MSNPSPPTRFRFWLWLIRLTGVIVPRRLRSDWRQEWEAELRHRERSLAVWDRLDGRKKIFLLWRSLAALWDALLLQPRRLEDEMFQDVRFGIRMLLRSPGWTAVIILTLAVGVGAVTSVFSIVNAALWRPLPFDKSDRLVFIGGTDAQGKPTSVSAADFEDFRRQGGAFEQVAAYRGQSLTLTGNGDPEFLQGEIVSVNFFETLGVRPAVGRIFLPEDARAGAEPVVILGHNIWERRFGASAAVLGQTITLNGENHTIVGVMPKSFSMWGLELWTAGFREGDTPDRANRSNGVLGRLRPEVQIQQAGAELSVIAAGLARSYSETNQGVGARVLPLRDAWYTDDRKALFALFGAAGLVLLIAHVNVANLLLARSTARSREMALRSALGAGRFRIARQLLVESLLINGLGAGCGILLAQWSLKLFVAFIPRNMLQFSIPGGGDAIGVDPATLLFTAAILALASVCLGLAPALQTANVDLRSALKASGKNAWIVGSGQRFRRALVVAEIALALTLLIGAGLLIKSFARLEALDRGFNPDPLLNFFVSLPQNEYRNDQQRIDFFTQAIERMLALPGAESAAAWVLVSARARVFEIQGRGTSAAEQEPKAIQRTISPGLFKTLGVRLQLGRDFSNQDTSHTPNVCIVSQTLARRAWPDEDPIGKQIRIAGASSTSPPWLTIVGVAGDIRESLDPRTPLAIEPQPMIYRPYMQAPVSGMSFVLAAKTDPLSMVAPARSEIAALDRELPITGIRAGREALIESVARPRFNMLLLAIFAGAALLMATIGVYEIMAYTVGQRTQEIGVRMALGAEPRQVLRALIGEGLRLSLLGLALGLAASLALTRVLKSLLFDVSAIDPGAFAYVSSLLVLVVSAACYFPTRRAVRLDPMIALRRE
jgi:putative ABC transport system permease protein